MEKDKIESVVLTVDVQTFNTIMAGLEELPHKVSRKIIDDLVTQVQPQIQGSMSAAPPDGPLSKKVLN